MLLILSILTIALGASSQSYCAVLLDEAKSLYRNGKLEQAIEKIEGCAWSRSTPKSARKSSLNLLTKCYLFNGQNKEARDAYLELLKMDPFYDIDENAPEIKYLIQQFETYPYSTYYFQYSPYQYTQPILLTQRAPNGIEILNADYKRKSGDFIGWNISAGADFNPFRKSGAAISTAYTLSTNFYRYNAELDGVTNPLGLNDQATLSFIERQRWHRVSLGLSWHLKDRSKVIKHRYNPFAYARLGFNFLQHSSAQFSTMNVTYASAPNLSSTAPPSIIANNRNHFLLSAEVGGGLRWLFNRSYLLTGVQYERMLGNLSQQNPDILEKPAFYFVDDDFSLHQIGIYVGGGIYFYKSRRL